VHIDRRALGVSRPADGRRIGDLTVPVGRRTDP
jgi:hypothetical protein